MMLTVSFVKPPGTSASVIGCLPSGGCGSRARPAAGRVGAKEGGQGGVDGPGGRLVAGDLGALAAGQLDGVAANVDEGGGELLPVGDDQDGACLGVAAKSRPHHRAPVHWGLRPQM